MVDLGGSGYNTTILGNLFNPHLKMLRWLSHPVQSSIYRWFSHSNFHLSRWCPWFSKNKSWKKSPWKQISQLIFPWKLPFVADEFMDFPSKNPIEKSLAATELRKTCALRPRTPNSTKAWKNPSGCRGCNYYGILIMGLTIIIIMNGILMRLTIIIIITIINGM